MENELFALPAAILVTGRDCVKISILFHANLADILYLQYDDMLSLFFYFEIH
jgi:hypothetical protein